MGLRKYLNNSNWNIGFAEITPDELISQKKLPKIKWVKHPYRDRFFADPFILDVNDSVISVLVEELIFGHKGTIIQLDIDRKTFRLLNRTEILRKDTHLSYPLIIKKQDTVYVYPENGESGSHSEYIYNKDNHVLVYSKEICGEPLTDATPLTFEGNNYLFSTRMPDSLKDAHLYIHDRELEKYVITDESPVVKESKNARMGGNFFESKGETYRPAQNCSKRYGGSLGIYKVESINPFKEKKCFELMPSSWRYNLGIHTLNFDIDHNLAVVDSYGYLYPLRGRLMMMLYRLKHLIK